jgi:hypothetical protein
MAKWVFEPGRTAAEFRARHMMVTEVRGAFKNVQGTLDFDPENPRLSAVQAMIDTSRIWTGEPQRDAHLRSADFLDVENYPQITFRGDQVELSGEQLASSRSEASPGPFHSGSATSVNGKRRGGNRRGKVGRPRTEVARGFFGDNRDPSS